MTRALPLLALAALALVPCRAAASDLDLRIGAYFPSADRNLFDDDADLYGFSAASPIEDGDWIGVYGGAEWRFRLTRDGFLGGALFANASTFSRPAYGVPGYSVPGEGLFSRIRPAGGFGLRFMMNREARNNVTLDVAFGQDSAGIYFGAGEAF